MNVFEIDDSILTKDLYGPSARGAAVRPPEGPVHAAADAHVAAFKAIMMRAFARGRAVLDKTKLKKATSVYELDHAMAQVPEVVKATLLAELPKVLLACLKDGGNAGLLILEPKLKAAGGHGSGNFGHAGRPGEIGGSSDSEDSGDVFLSAPHDAFNSIASGERATVVAADVRSVLKEAAYSKIGPVDLTNLTVEGTPIFAGGLGLNRLSMPQISKEEQPAFLASLKEQGIGVKNESVSPLTLKPTQNEIDAGRVGQQLESFDQGKTLRPILVSKDDYVLDGHHRWAVETALAFENPKAGIKIPVIRLMKDHTKSLALMLAYTKKHGIKAKALEVWPRTLAKPKLTMAFDVKNPNAIKWAEEHAAELATGISDTTRQDIADAIVSGFETGDTEQMIEDLIDAVGDEDRADLIARTESMYAANEGQREGWDQAVEEGLLTGAERRAWIATDDATVCNDCDALDGEETELDGTYPGDGEDGPPLHPNCRCTEGLVS